MQSRPIFLFIPPMTMKKAVPIRLCCVILVAWLASGCGLALFEPTPEPLVPTRTPAAGEAVAQSSTATAPAPTTAPAATPTPDAIPLLTAGEAAVLERIGIAGSLDHVEPAARLGLRAGQFTFWRVSPELPDAPGTAIWQTVRLGQIEEWAQWPAVQDEMARTLRDHPGGFWLIGNEPDVIWQDNATAEEYAAAYHDIYEFIKSRDPTAQVGAGGVSLPTPLRLAYLDNVLAAYRDRYGVALPADLWAVHLFVLREEAGSWGIDIPPGMDATSGALHEIADHGDLALMQGYVVAFRDWLAANGYSDKPLAVTEFGILLPEDYGFPPEFVQSYLVEAYEYFRTASGPTGLAADGGRLVQYAFWFSLYDDGEYPTGNLYDAERDALTPLGEVYRAYVDGLTP
ncbi:conserved protein of unknown function [Candidatus Promineifilum breve]|uniref:Asl1-like glycosyl hydrolase catalytic domain-containing protein n=2 Tax=Candidatus Promineifilum breve TaxID=1806508 RepID=A0A160T3B9_9CHLR|nr:conserved protein of unknown function [Candidatus Promineifilum breve]